MNALTKNKEEEIKQELWTILVKRGVEFGLSELDLLDSRAIERGVEECIKSIKYQFCKLESKSDGGETSEAEEEIEEILTDEAKDRMNYELIEEKYFD